MSVMPTADIVTEPRAADEPNDDPRVSRPAECVVAVSESRWRRWRREAWLDAQLLGLGLVVVLVIGLVAIIV